MRLDPRRPSDARVLAREAATVPPRESWWTQHQAPEQRAQWSATADARAKELNAVTSNQHVRRGE